MPKGYVILTESIKDPAGMDAYRAGRGRHEPVIVSGFEPPSRSA